MRCTRYKRVRSRFGGTVRRCANFSGGRKRGYRRKGRSRGGSHCVSFKRVPSRYFQKMVVRCAQFRGGRRGGTKRGGYRRGHRPFNKGLKCRTFKMVRGRGGRLFRRCASFKGGPYSRGPYSRGLLLPPHAGPSSYGGGGGTGIRLFGG
jgi:hypothetical protein